MLERAAQIHEERLKPGRCSDDPFTQGRQQAASPRDTAGRPQAPGGTRTRWLASAQLSRPGRGTQRHEAFLLFTTAPGRAV